MIALIVAGFVLAAPADLVPVADKPDTPTYRNPLSENFGLRPFSATTEQLEQGRRSQIASAEQQKVWEGLASLLGSQHGYHTPEEVGAAFGIKLIMTHKPSNTGDTARWDAELPNAHLILFENSSESKIFGQSSSISINWNASLGRPNCISALKAFASIQDAGGTGFRQIGTTKEFGMQGGEDIEISSRGMSDQTCLSKFALNGRVDRRAARF